ncbi:MAG: polysaccharide deacetylase family protein [Rectinema subterraneum]|uniref:polysaccharide deacetylase family protein n=1 Tax=Rectinema subterraneum TaxID=2653714 RepID=UPI003C7A1508
MIRHQLFPIVIILLAILLMPAFGASQIIILDYHSFLGSGKSSLDFSPEEFASQIDRFLALGYHFVPLVDALNGQVQGDNCLALTIDDGHRTVWTVFTQVLKPRHIPVTLFIPAFSVGHDKHLLTVDQLRRLYLEGCVIGAHGFYHNYMTSKAFEADSKKVLTEAMRPGPAIATMLGAKPLLFAYPFGAAGPSGKAAVQQAGYKWAFAAGSKIIPVRFDDPVLDHFYIPRTIVYRWNIDFIFRVLAERTAH